MENTITRKEAQYNQIRKHGEDLNRIFNTGLEPIALCKKLHRLEVKAHKLATDYCNGENGVNTDNWDKLCYPILQSVRKILKINNEYLLASDDSWPIILNGDARGYALKIHDSYVSERQLSIHKDWGGFGIIAPEFNGE